MSQWKPADQISATERLTNAAPSAPRPFSYRQSAIGLCLQVFGALCAIAGAIIFVTRPVSFSALANSLDALLIVSGGLLLCAIGRAVSYLKSIDYSLRRIRKTDRQI